MSKIFFLTLAAVLSVASSQVVAPPTTSAFNATREFVTYYNYPFAEFDVTTSDGYILKLYRIPGSPVSAPAPGKKAVLIIHGFYTSSIDYVNLGSNHSLPYLCADQGYDVWLGNLRGNTLSRRHVTLNPDSDAFWNFSFHESGMYDLPAFIDFILQTTGNTKLHYVGWSGSTASFLVMGSQRKSYMSKISSAHLMSPASFFTHAVSPPYRALSIWPGGFYSISQAFGLREFLPDSGWTQTWTNQCRDETTPTNGQCYSIIYLVAGWGSTQVDSANLPLIYRYSPAGASTKSVIHISQLFATVNFQQFDYGFSSWENWSRYGWVWPPSYNLNNVNAPVALWYGDNDWLSSTIDVDRLANNLPNLIGKYLTPVTNWNHIDYLWGRDARTLIYEKMIVLMKQRD